MKDGSLYLTVHAWCTFGGSEKKKTPSYNLAALPNRHYAFYAGRRPGLLAPAGRPGSEGARPPGFQPWSRWSLRVAGLGSAGASKWLLRSCKDLGNSCAEPLEPEKYLLRRRWKLGNRCSEPAGPRK